MTGSQRAYYEFMDYDSDALRARYAPYAERFFPGSRVADIGCGRGEFLELLAARGVDGVGVDADSGMVDYVRGRGLNAEHSDAASYLRSNREELDGVFAAHLAEHMAAAALRSFVGAAFAALRPGGRLLLVTPNARNLEMQLHEFWVDLQHVRFYTPENLRLILQEAGLKQLEDGENALYRTPLAPIIPEIEQFAIADFEPMGVPHPTRLGVLAKGRQRLAEWLTPASTLERIQAVENAASALRAEANELKDAARRLQRATEKICNWAQGLYPAGEFWVTGVK